MELLVVSATEPQTEAGKALLAREVMPSGKYEPTYHATLHSILAIEAEARSLRPKATPEERYRNASVIARARENHGGEPDSLEVVSRWRRPTSAGCSGRLRTAYVRKIVAERPKWVPVGIVCTRCSAYWVKPERELAE